MKTYYLAYGIKAEEFGLIQLASSPSLWPLLPDMPLPRVLTSIGPFVVSSPLHTVPLARPLRHV